MYFILDAFTCYRACKIEGTSESIGCLKYLSPVLFLLCGNTGMCK